MKALEFNYTGNFEQWEEDFVWFQDLLFEFNRRLTEDQTRVRRLWENVLIICFGQCEKEDRETVEEQELLSQRFKVIQQLLVAYKEHHTIHNAVCRFEINNEVIKVPLNDFYLSQQLVQSIIQNILNCDMGTISTANTSSDQFIERAIAFCQRSIEEYGKKVNNPRVIALFSLFDWFQQRGFRFENNNQFLRFIWEIARKFDLFKTPGLDEWVSLGIYINDTNLRTGWWNDCRGVLKNYYAQRNNFNLHIVNNDRILSYKNGHV